MGDGIGSIFKAMAMAPAMRQQAERDAALRSAQTYGANMQGNLAGSKAEQERYTLTQRQAPVDEAMPQYLQSAQKIFQMTGDTNAERVANAGTAAQTQSIRDQALASVEDADMMNRLNTLAKPGATYMPFDNVGNTGRTMNKATGEGAILDATLAKLFDGVQQSAASENYAQANNANASAGKHSAGREQILLESGILRDTGKLPGRAGSGEDSTNAKTRNALIAAVEKELFGAGDDEIMAEVERRLSRRGIGGGAPKAEAGPKPGTVEGGYRFKGGDPANAKNWEKM